MVRMKAPLNCKTARGWIGGDMYGKRWYKAGIWHTPKYVVVNPYPIGMLGHIHIPYSFWDRNIHGMYSISAFPLDPYKAFISKYYSVKGWCYEQRRTWHGMQPIAYRAAYNPNRNSLYQIAASITMYDAVQTWRTMADQIKDVYNQLKSPKIPSGYNKFIHSYIREKGAMPINWGREEIVLDIDGGGSAITTGIKSDLRVPFPCKIKSWQLLADAAGDIVIDIWKDTYANFPPTNADSICAGNEPALVGVAKNKNDTASGFSLLLAEGDILRFNVDSVATVKRVHLSIPIEIL